MTQVKCKRIGTHDLPLPTYATDGSAAVDLRANVDAVFTLWDGQCRLIPTGFAMQIPDHLDLFLLPRSGIGHKHGIILGNGVGLIDADYRGEVMVSAWNRSDDPYVISPGDRICQAVLLPRITAEFIEVDELDATERGAGGFGSSGRS